MKKFIFIIFIPIFIFFIAALTLYNSAQKPYVKAEEKAAAAARNDAGIVTVTDFYLYHGQETYYVLKGQTEKNVEKVVWIPKDKKKKQTVRTYKEGVTKEQALKKLMSEQKPEELLSIKLGMEKNKPVWEITFVNSRQQLSYYYLLFDSGKWLKKIDNI
ncbi:uncharacterized protein YpmB [Bacillus ectoiniformans]|uniref:cell wall elongation regulator TseB-like domain-containing protein n=1 Tax=Bacillus ectoiniformans TaxID=1494429 RepID=UPI0019585911|nr:DUF5590 domain-containing protein [Bacillus ectoiniformans]MBM7647962.1 uncharacterized protein YpmB [Bacillus ectoiniformans]